MTGSLGSSFEKIDMFGHQVPLYYCGSKKVKNSMFGATMTLSLGMLVVVYTVLSILQAKDTGNQRITQMQYDLDLGKEQPIMLNQSDTKMFATLYLTD